MKSVATILVEHLKEWGVAHVFGVPGKAIIPLVLEVGNQGIQYVLSRHEAGAGFAAAGYAMKKRTIGVAIGTSGPGGTNLLTAAGQAKAYHVPVLFITGHPSMKDTGKPLGQDSTFYATDLVEMFRSVTLFSARLERGDLLQSYLTHAIDKAISGVRGPVHLSIPGDVLVEKITPFTISFPPRSPQIMSTHLSQIIPLLNQAKKPLLFLGKGVHISEAYEEVQQLAETWQMPVMTTPGGKGTFPTRHPLSLGAYGLGGTQEAAAYLKSGVDVMVVVGTKLSDMSIPGITPNIYPNHIIQFDVDPTFVGKSLPVSTLLIQGDAKFNLQNVLEMVPRVSLYSSLQIAAAASSPPTVEPSENFTNQRITAVEVMQILSHSLPENAIVFGDDGSHSYHAIHNLEIIKPGSFLFDDVFACMGHAIGYSIGAKLALPDKPVICLTGDGCLFMHGSEISTAVNNGIGVIFVVLNNGQLDMVNKGMKYNVGRTDGTVFDIPLNVEKYAESMGAKAYRCQTGSEFEQAFLSAMEGNHTTVIDVLVDPEEIPPTMARG